MIFRYDSFIGDKLVNENIQQSKKFLKDRYVLAKAAKSLNLITGELDAKLKEGSKKTISLSDFNTEQQEKIKDKIREIRITDDEVRSIEKDAEYVKVKELLKDNPGWTYIFVYFYFVEMVPFEELGNIYNQLLEFKQLLSRLPKQLDANFIDPSIPNNSEKLVDALENLSRYRKLKKFLDQLPGELRREYGTAIKVIKDKLEDIAVAFDDIGKDTEGKIDTESRDALQKVFFSKVRRYNTLRDLLIAAESYIKGLDNEGTVRFYRAIEKCNSKFGNYGVEIVYDNNGILIIEVKSFAANKMLNANTSHCIASSSYQWDSYVGGDSNFNKQYYIYNFNLSSSDDLSVIGITIAERQGIRACHTKSDRGYSGEIKNRLNAWERAYKIEDNLWSYLKPMTDEEIAAKRKRIIANREIVKKGLTIDQIKKYVKEDGADVNAGNGAALENAVVENDIEKVKVLLELGASPNLKQKNDCIINKAKSLDMIKLLVSHHAELTSAVFKNIIEDYDAVEYCLKAGLDPNFENNLPVRMSCRVGNLDILKLLVKYGGKLEHDRNMPICWAAEYGRKNIIEYFIERGLTTGFESVLKWTGHSKKLCKKECHSKAKDCCPDKAEMMDYLEGLIKSGRVTK